MNVIRLFIAIPLSQSLRDRLTSQIDQLRASGVQRNFTRPENLHMTLAFIGETQRKETVVECVREVPVSPFFITLATLGRFCGRNGDIYYAGIQPSATLYALTSALENLLLEAGFPLENRTFLPHITLGRALRSSRDFDFTRYASIPLHGHMRVNAIDVLCSQHIEGKLVYTPVERRFLYIGKEGKYERIY